MIGTRLGPYEIVELVGKGGMATVYRAFHPNVERFVAVKVIHTNFQADPDLLERFLREAQLVARLEHPHILPLYDYDGRNTPPYIVMRFLQGGTLEDLTRRGRLPLGEVVYMFNQICAAIDYAHRQGVIHRDIKPSNILVDEEGNAFVTDFGIARVNANDTQGGGSLTQTGFAVGTPGYMSPEQALGEKNIDARTDLYALGVMLWEVLTGRLPYTADTPMGVMLKHIQEPVPDPHTFDENMHPAIAAVLTKSIDKDRNNRFATANAFAEAFAIAVEQSGTTLTASPTMIRKIAQTAIRERYVEKKSDETDVNTLLAQFADTRNQARANVATMPPSPTAQMDGARTVFTNTQLGAQVEQSSNRNWIYALVGLLVLGGGIAAGYLFNQNNQTAILATQLAIVPTHTPTLTLTATPTVTLTATPSIPLAYITRNVVVRSAPSETATELETLRNGDIFELSGMNSQRDWFEIVLSDGSKGWIPMAEELFSTVGNVEALPIAEVPTATATPSLTPTDLPTATPTATATMTVTLMATATHTPPSPSATLLPPTATATLSPTATPLLGSLPYFTGFETADSIVNWEVDAEAWQVINENGEDVLVGQGNLRQTAIIEGLDTPEWLDVDAMDLVTSFKFNLDPNAGGIRYVFRESEAGYYALEFFPGLVVFKRNAPEVDIFDRDSERYLHTENAALRGNTWYTATIWAQGARLYVYLDYELLFVVDDLIIPSLQAGRALFQVNSTNRPIRLDNLHLQRAESVSDRFDLPSFPTTWQRSDSANVTIEREANGNQYVRLNREATLQPQDGFYADAMNISFRLWSEVGGFSIAIQESEDGRLMLEGSAGNVDVKLMDSAGEVIQTFPLVNFYGRTAWEDVTVRLVGDQLMIFNDGQLRLDERLSLLLPEGIIRISTTNADTLRIDDVLITQTERPSN
ncbi:MAG: protein kinase domain-containing protein [Phototrophicaceae bacterium]